MNVQAVRHIYLIEMLGPVDQILSVRELLAPSQSQARPWAMRYTRGFFLLHCCDAHYLGDRRILLT